MKFIRIIGILFVLFVVSLITEKCVIDGFDDYCKCPKSESFEYSISSFSFKQYDGLAALPSYVECRRDFGIWFVFETEKTVIANCKPLNSLFMQSAYACSCINNAYYPKDRIISIQVFSDKDFGETHPSGTDIADFFNVLMGIHGGIISFESFFEHPIPYWSVLSDFVCVLTATTIKAGEYEFTFVVNLSDERTLEQSIKTVLR